MKYPNYILTLPIIYRSSHSPVADGEVGWFNHCMVYFLSSLPLLLVLFLVNIFGFWYNIRRHIRPKKKYSKKENITAWSTFFNSCLDDTIWWYYDSSWIPWRDILNMTNSHQGKILSYMMIIESLKLFVQTNALLVAGCPVVCGKYPRIMS